MISLAPALSDGQRVYTIVFSSNAPDPENFDGTIRQSRDSTDGNSEIWIYRLPAVPDVDLTLGADLPFDDLTIGGDFRSGLQTQMRAVAPRAGSANHSAVFCGRQSRTSDLRRRQYHRFYLYSQSCSRCRQHRWQSRTVLLQRWQRQRLPGHEHAGCQPGIGLVFQSNPISVCGWISSVFYLQREPGHSNNADGNAEIFLANFGGGGLSNIRQVTRHSECVTSQRKRR